MSFIHFDFLPHIIAAIIFISFLIWKVEGNHFVWVKKFWFYTRSKSSKIASFTYIVGISILLLSLLDLRGPSEVRKTKIPEQKTVLLIDVSLSMLAEDIRPSRLRKAVQTAKHFVRKAAGHKISILIFSDTTKQLVPFTKDIDLLDARLNSLKELDLNRGGSSIRKAMEESLSFLRGKKETVGNILVISDSDETYDGWDLNFPDTVSVGYVAVGTAKGSKIPLRSKDGVIRVYKKYRKQEVISKLNETELKNLSQKIDRYKYWILGSYSIPTEDVLNFFDKSHSAKYSENDSIIRPVMMEYLAIPAILFICLSLLLRLRKSYVIGLIFVLSFQSYGEEQKLSEEDIKEMKIQKIKGTDLFKKFSNGEANRSERLKLAEEYLKEGLIKRSLQIYNENINDSDAENIEMRSAYFNYATNLMMAKESKKGILAFKKIKNYESNEDLKEQIRDNIVALLRQNKQEQQNKQDKQKDKDQDKKDQNKKEQNDKNDQKKDQKNKSQDGKDDQEKKDQDKQDKQDEEKDKKGKKEKNDDDKKEQKKEDIKNEEQKKKEQKNNQGKKKKLPVILKQLIDKDRKLQEKYMDTKTQDRSMQQQKDW